MVDSSVHTLTSTQMVRDFPRLKQLASSGIVEVTNHGRPELVVMSYERYQHLGRSDEQTVNVLEAKLSIVLESIDTLIVILDHDLRIQRANSAMREAFNVDFGPIEGLRADELVRTPTDQFFLIRMRDVLNSGREEVLVMPAPHRPNRIFRYLIKPWPNGVALFGTDVTELNMARDRQVADVAIDYTLERVPGLGIGRIYQDGTFLSASRGLTQLLNIPRETLIGARLHTILDPQSRPVLNDALSEQNHRSMIQVRYLRRGTEMAQATLIITPYWASNNRACAAIAFHDIGLATAGSGEDQAGGRQPIPNTQS